MSTLRGAHDEQRVPTRAEAWWFAVRARGLQMRRGASDLVRGRAKRLSRKPAAADWVTRGEWKSELWNESGSASERRLELGKVQNLRAAAQRLDGISVPAGETWSFWRQVGRATRRRGFAEGRELRVGCLIPSIGGGLCQLSGAIYNAALEAGMEIVERHAHTERGVSTLARLGRDATVFWNYVDLRVRAPFDWRLEVKLGMDRLEVRMLAERTREGATTASAPVVERSSPVPNACDACGVTACHRHRGPGGVAREVDRVAVLVDEYWPEFDEYLREMRNERTLFCRPLDGRRWRKANYAWTAEGYGATASAPWTTLRRAWATRRLREQGAARQKALLAWDERLARDYAGRLKAEHSHLVVAQNLLPFLWRDGVLGGRTFDVLMVRQPMAALQAALDGAARLHPESKTCGDFRAPAWLVKAESEALAQAGAWITPHSGIAAMAGDRAIVLPWSLPARAQRPEAVPGRIVFPASTLCRKGAYELRSALREVDAELVCAGGFLEDAGFWDGLRVRRAEGGDDWLAGASVVVLPSFVEHRPRRLLQTLARGVPVIATAECGLGAMAGVMTVPAGDVGALVEALSGAWQAGVLRG
jgi:hypothetical protein